MKQATLATLPPEVLRLVDLCKSEMRAAEVWLFGRRASGDHGKGSDFDILAIIPDDAPRTIDTPLAALRLRRMSGACVDLLTARHADFAVEKAEANLPSCSHLRYGLRLDN